MTLQVQVSGAPSPMTDAEKSDVLTTLGAVSTAALTAHAGSTGNPHNVTKAQVGLGNVDNTGDADKPVSAAQTAAIAGAVTAHVDAADPHPGKYAAPDHAHTLLMTSDERTKLGALPTAAELATAQAAQDTAINGKAPAGHTHAPASIGAATEAQGSKADTALQPGVQLTQGAVTATTAAGVALLGAANAAAQRTALGLGTAATTASTAYATAAQGAKADTALQPGSQLTQAAVTGATAAGVALIGAADAAAQRTAMGAMASSLPAMQAAYDAGTAPEKAAFRSSVSGGKYKVVGTLAEVLAAAGSVGDEALATDIGSVGVVLRWSAVGAWRLGSTCNLRTQMTQVVGVADTTEQVLGQFDVPAGMLQLCDYWSVHVLWVRNSTAANMTCRVRLGTGSPLLSDAAMLTYTQMAATGLTFPTAAALQVTLGNPSQVRPIGAQNGLEEWPGIVSGAGFPGPVNIGLNTAGTNLKLTATMQAASAGPIPSVAAFILKGHA